MSAVNVSIRLVDGSLREYDTGPDLLVDLAALQVQGLAGRRLIHALLSDDWSPPPVYVDISGDAADGRPINERIPYR
jgi:hypothetical protein